MNWFSLFLLVVLLIALSWFAYRYFTLRQQIRDYTYKIRNASAIPLLPEDEQGLEDFSNAVKTFFANLNLQLDMSEAERARLAAVLDQMTDGVLIVDPFGRILFANPAAEKILGNHLLERSVTEALRHHQLIQAWQRCYESGEVQTESVELPARRQFLQLIVMPDLHTPGGTLLLVQDLTRLRRLETVRRDFVSNLSHELRTPLASLKALAETLQDGALDDPPAARRFVDRMQTEVDALTQMVNELLELSRIESGRLILDLKPVAAYELLFSASERMRLQTERAGLNLRVTNEDDNLKVRADAARLEQVLVNLIHNAVKFTKPGGEIALLAEAGEGGAPFGDVIRFAVRDNGVGISADDLSRIFERFYKSDRSRAGGGTGLGLSIARHIVEAHGGKIWAESREGDGSIFFFTIPSQPFNGS
ncbi:MAG: PAS domain-containing protein [Chloroflexi bacterium]|nr:PAS domain-containing protein [Chloroflexota bacterium]